MSPLSERRLGGGADRARGLRSRTARLALLALPALLAGTLGCASAGSDVHLAPFYTRTSTADGARETEVLGGLWQHRTRLDDGSLEELTFGPFYGTTPAEDGHLSHFLVPLGYASRHGEEANTSLFPIFTWFRVKERDGTTSSKFLMLPGIFFDHNEEDGVHWGVWPLYGELDDFATYERIVFVLWPFIVYAERDGRVSWHLPWPFLGWTTGGGESSFRLFPFFGWTKNEGRFDRHWILWPIWHYQENFLGGGGEEPETAWLLWPFYGRSARGTFVAHTVLWPFFGWSSDPRSGFWALDLPWPFVRFQRGPGEVHRSRVWPFYSYTRADGLETTSYLWPIVQLRSETYADSVGDSAWVIPFWQSWDRTDLESGETSAWRKLFPLFQHERVGAVTRGSFPTLDPFWRNELVDRHYAWIWKLWEWRRAGEVERDRAWLGLWERERTAHEERRSLSGLWASRRYEKDGATVRETSLLFGLLRWRVTEGAGYDMLRPALPGPGWPALEPAPDPFDRLPVPGRAHLFEPEAALER